MYNTYTEDRNRVIKLVMDLVSNTSRVGKESNNEVHFVRRVRMTGLSTRIEIGMI